MKPAFILAALSVLAASAGSRLCASPDEIEQRYVTSWNPEPVARFSTARPLVINAARCRIDDGPFKGKWLDGRAVGTVLGTTVWRIAVGSLPPGAYTVTHDLRTPTGAEWVPGILRVPQIARHTGAVGTKLRAPDTWPQDRYEKIACDEGVVQFAWDRDNLYARTRDPNSVEITIDALPVVSGRHTRKVTVAGVTTIPWSNLFPAIPLTGQTIRCRIEGGGASDWIDLLFIGTGQRQYFGATMVSSGPGGDDQGPPVPILKAQMEFAGFDLHSVSVTWEDVESADPGTGSSTNDWSQLKTNENLYKSGLVLCSINLQNHWAEPLKTADPDRYWRLAESFVSEAAKRCAAAGVTHFTLGYNEPEMFFRTDKEDYFNNQLTHCANAVRKAVPDAVVVAGRFSSGDPQLIGTFYAHGFRDNFDVLDLHTYSNDPITGTAMGEIVACHELLNELGMGRKRIFLGEGWGPTRNLPQVKRDKWDEPVSPEEADVTRQYFQNGYRCLVTARADFSPDWVLGAKYFTLNDNVGGTYWRQAAKPVYSPTGELLGQMIGELRFGPDADDLKAFFCNGGLLDFFGRPKGQWFYDFPPALPEVRVQALGGPDYVLAGEWRQIDVSVVNANPSPITDLRLGVRDRTGKLDGKISAEAVGESTLASLAPGEVWRPAFRVRVDSGKPRRIRWALELDYTYDGEKHVSDDIVRTEIREPIAVSVDPYRIVLDGPAEKKLTVKVRNNKRSSVVCEPDRHAGAGFTAVPSVKKLELNTGEEARFDVTIKPAKPEPGLSRFEPIKGVEKTALIVVPLPCPRAKSAPTIDGDLSDWPRDQVAAGAIRFIDSVSAHARPADDPFPKPGQPAASSAKPETFTFGANAALAWDDAGLYLAAMVEDRTFSQRYSGADVWREDSVQIGLDPLLDADMSEGYRPDDYEIALALTSKGPEITAVTAPKDVPRGPLAGAHLAVRRQGAITTYEAMVPWTAIGLMGRDLESRPPKPGARFGFDILVNNFEDGRRYTLAWAGGIAHGKYPGLFVPIILR